MNFRLAIIPLSCVQLGWSVVTLTMQDPTQKPIPGVSCAVGAGAAAVSDANGLVAVNASSGIIPIRQDQRNNPLFDIPVSMGDKANLIVFNSRGQQVVRREIRHGESFDFSNATPGVYHVRITGRNLNVTQSVPVMGGRLAFSGVTPAYEASNAARKSAAAVDVVCSKAGYATKSYPLNDGETKTIGFGIQIGRAFNPADFPKYPGFNLEVAEDFTTAKWAQGLKWDGAYVSNDVVWEPSDGGFGGNKVRFHPDNILFKDDAMVFKLEKPAAEIPSSFSHSEGDNCEAIEISTNKGFCTTKFAPKADFKGAEVRTKENHFRFGRYEITIDPPDRGPGPGTADGFIAAMFTWFTPRDLHWRENDIEVLATKTKTFLTNIFFTNKDHLWNASIESSNHETAGPANYDPRQSNTYAFEWLPTSVKWYVNGQLVRTYGTGGTTKPGVEISQMSTKIVMNFWIMAGGAVGGEGNGNVYPIETKFDNFRYYRWDEDGDKKTYPEKTCINPLSQGCSKLPK